VKEGDSNLFRRETTTINGQTSPAPQLGFKELIRLLIFLRSSSLFSLQRFGILESQKRRCLMTVKINKKN
jgi:hypothetical protein